MTVTLYLIGWLLSGLVVGFLTLKLVEHPVWKWVCAITAAFFALVISANVILNGIDWGH